MNLIRWSMKYIDIILNSKKTVFTYNDIGVLLKMQNKDTIKSFFARRVKDNIFRYLHKWTYGLKDYNRFELWSKIKKWSYISFETVLEQEGVIFQDYGNIIMLSSNNTLTKTIDGHVFSYYKLKDSILYNPLWLINKKTYTIATKERALCDRLYLTPDYYFDNLDGIDYDLLESISTIYDNKRVILSVQNIIHAQQRKT